MPSSYIACWKVGLERFLGIVLFVILGEPLCSHLYNFLMWLVADKLKVKGNVAAFYSFYSTIGGHRQKRLTISTILIIMNWVLKC